MTIGTGIAVAGASIAGCYVVCWLLALVFMSRNR